MLMNIAIAKDGFIDTKQTPNFTGKTTFLECLQEVLNFEEKDLMEFDGNTCQLVNSYNPTNSIFIYTNQQGTFLYTITDATPRVHKNNFIWDCNCYKMEDVSIIETILGSGKKAESIVFKNIAPTNDFDETGVNSKLYIQNTPDYNVEVKENFRTQEVLKGNINLDYWCYKLKFLTNPTNDNTLITKEEDGSFNFFFPFYMGVPSKDTHYLFPLGTPTSKIKYGNDVYTMQDIIKKYSSNLKSVELIPFFPYGDGVLGGTLTMTTSGDTIEITSISGATFTDAGIFFPYGHTTKRSLSNELTNSNFVNKLKFKALNVGGGINGKLVLPLGEVPINFNSFRLSQRKNLNEVCLYIKSEGWKLDGLIEADAPPHYINFYTNETGQLFIANMTTNAQELREINRQNEYQKTQMGLSKTEDLLSGIITNAFSGNIGGIVGTIGNTALGVATELAKAEVDYNKAIASYEDKIKTQSLLAQMTGKQISGNALASDIIINLSRNYFVFIFELNYSDAEYYDSVNNVYYRHKIPQKDYDYSTQYTGNEQKKLIVNKTGSFDTDTEYNNVADFVENLFGFYDGSISGDKKIVYYDGIGLNYNVTFKIVSLPNTTPTQYGTITDDLEETQILNFAIRHKQKYFA